MKEMNYIRKISIETSGPAEPGPFNLRFGICGHAVNVLAEHETNYFETITKMG
jgi:hypothetical protein